MRKAPILFVLALSLTCPAGASPNTLRLPGDSVAAMVLGGRPLCLVSEASRYRWENGELQPEEGLFSFFTADQQPLQARPTVPEMVFRGEALQGCLLFDQGVDRLDVTLQQRGGELSFRAKGFAVDREERSWCFLLGIPSTAESGEYTLEIRATRARRFLLYRGELEVHHKSFRSEEISFDRSLSELMTEPDPRKAEEYRELVGLLSAFHSRAIFHTGALSFPVQATRRTSRFADRRLYSFSDGGSSRSLHNGVDLAAPVGEAVFASAAGRVLLARERIITGNSVVIEHLPGVYTLYYHLEEIEVQEGQRLHQGQRIGTVGMAGLATGPHLHWELRIGGVAVDPDMFLHTPMIDKTAFSHNIMDQN